MNTFLSQTLGTILRGFVVIVVASLLTPSPLLSSVHASSGSDRAISNRVENGSFLSSTKLNNAEALATEAFDKLPLAFEANQGQTDSRVKFISRGSGYTLFLTSTEAVLALSQPAPGTRSSGSLASRLKSGALFPNLRMSQPATVESSVLRMKFVGANLNPTVQGANRLPSRTNYYIGNNSKRWREGINNYGSVHYSDLYPGIDLIYYGNQNQLEYDFNVAPGADASRIKLAFEGAKRVSIDANGDLLLETSQGTVRQHRPFVYQELETGRKEIPSRYLLHSTHSVGFEIAPYDKTRKLIIDPVLSYSTFLGGNNNDVGYGIAVDAGGNAYVVGITNSLNFPTTPGAYSTTFNDVQPHFGGGDVFVSKLDPTGTSLVYSTYIGGSDYDDGRSIAVDQSGNAYIAGATLSGDFPTLNAFQPNFAGNGNLDGFVTKLNPAGSALVYSTYLGGASPESAHGIAINTSGNAYVVGVTSSADFPVKNALKSIKGLNDLADGFVSVFSPEGDELVYSTYVGGTDRDEVHAVALDSANNVYITGATLSTNFPTVNAFQATKHSDGYDTAFVSKINSAGTAFDYSTYLGGTFPEEGFDIAVDSQGHAYVVGYTDSDDFPTTPGSFQPDRQIPSFIDSPFVTKLNPQGSALVYSTYLGGFGVARSVAVDVTGNACVTGNAGPNFPTTPDAYKRTYTGTFDNEVFITKLGPNSELLYSTYFGADGNDVGYAIALDDAGDVYVTGATESSAFPVTPGAFQTMFGGGVFAADAFVLKFDLTTVFDMCIQDDSNGNLLQIDSATGVYQFTNCSGFTMNGSGTLVKKGNITTLSHNESGRRVTARIDKSARKGSASIELSAPRRVFTITDRNTSNNTCTCD